MGVGAMEDAERSKLVEETLGQLRRAMTRTMASAANSLRGRQVPLLSHLTLHAVSVRGGLTQTELAEFLGVSTGYATSIVDQLEKVGWVRRHRDSVDRRVIHVKVTTKGLHEHDRLGDRGTGPETKLFKDWTDAEIRTFKDLLARLGAPRDTKARGRRAEAAAGHPRTTKASGAAPLTGQGT